MNEIFASSTDLLVSIVVSLTFILIHDHVCAVSLF